MRSPRLPYRLYSSTYSTCLSLSGTKKCKVGEAIDLREKKVRGKSFRPTLPFTVNCKIFFMTYFFLLDSRAKIMHMFFFKIPRIFQIMKNLVKLDTLSSKQIRGFADGTFLTSSIVSGSYNVMAVYKCVCFIYLSTI